MKEHVEEVSNMTCVLREMNVIDQNNNIDISAMKKDAKQYKLPSPWFGERYEDSGQLLRSCRESARWPPGQGPPQQLQWSHAQPGQDQKLHELLRSSRESARWPPGQGPPQQLQWS